MGWFNHQPVLSRLLSKKPPENIQVMVLLMVRSEIQLTSPVVEVGWSFIDGENPLFFDGFLKTSKRWCQVSRISEASTVFSWSEFEGVWGGYVLGGPKQPSSFQEGIQLDVLGMYRVK